MTHDVAIIGGGHNGLTCACYLAKAGLSVLVLERRNIVGGAVCTETDLVPGCRMDVGSSAHIMIHLTPVLAELELHRFGLEYIEMDPWASYPVLGSDQALLFWRDVGRTCDSIARVSPEDAAAYRRFVDRWGELNEGIFETFLAPPTPGRLVWTMLRRNLLRPRSRKLWSSLDTTRQLMAPYRQVVDEEFRHPVVRTALEWLAAQAGPSPTEIASGDLLGWNAMIHRSGAKRPRGGSGMLTQALARCLESHGGQIALDCEIASVARAGDRWEIVTASGARHDASRVVCAMHVVPFFTRILRGCPERLRARVANLRIGNGFGMIVRHHVSELPRYTGTEADPLCHRGLQLLCPDRDHLMSSFIDYQAGLPPARPSVVAMTFSSIDPTLAPEGTHTLFTWGQWHPYALANGEHWDAIAEREADKLYGLVCRYAPNMRGKILGRFIQTPLDIERRIGLVNANVMHLEMSLDQMFFFRPLPEIASYRTPMPGLYLTGASTHPGGGVFAASGRNTARAILRDRRR